MENIGIIMGGTSKEKNISLKSGETIYKKIDKSKYNAYKVIFVDHNHFEVLISKTRIQINTDDFSFILKKRKIKFQKVFMMIHGDPGENGKLCAYFESRNIPYTSCDERTSLLTFNKFKCNSKLRELGYKVPQANLYEMSLNIQFPCIVKPACSGSSFGITKAYNDNELKAGIKEANQHDGEVIIEEFIEGREFTCAVFNVNQIVQTLPITEIISENDIFDYDAKYNGKSLEETPAQIDSELKNRIEKISEQIYQDFNLSGFIRVDFIVKNQSIYIIEINTIPGFSEESIVPKMLKCANIAITEFITTQLENI